MSESHSQANGVDAAVVERARYKRPFDLVVVLISCALLAPVLLLLCAAISLVIKLEDRGRIFYVQTRLGQWGQPFRMFKFRTMVPNAEDLTGPVLAEMRDLRITKVGKVLRALHLDEIPQLVNVLKGDMSLVGPRPERPELAKRIERMVPGFSMRLYVKPGIAGLAQVTKDYHLRPRNKLRYDNLYVAKMGPWLDIKLLLRCAWVAVRQGAGDLQRSPAKKGNLREQPRKAAEGDLAIGKAGVAAHANGSATLASGETSSPPPPPPPPAKNSATRCH